MKTRRQILKGLIISIGGSSLLNSCGGIAQVNISTNGMNRFYSDEENAWVSKICDLIIPRTETPGAIDVNVPGFLDGLMAEWANSETQREHHNSLKKIKVQLGSDYLTIDEDSATNRLAQLDTKAFDGRPADFREYRSLKGLITQAYFASEDGALLEQKWVAVPGSWNPRVEI